MASEKSGSRGVKSAITQLGSGSQETGIWRSVLLSRLRALVKEADSSVVEEIKWKKPSKPGGVLTWSHHGLICTGEAYTSAVKMTFAWGASLDDPSGLFNASLEGRKTRAIDFHEGEKVNEKALKALIREAVAFNKSSGRC